MAPGFLSLLGFVYFLPIKCLWSYHTQSILGVLNLFLLGPVFDGNRSLRVTFYTQFFISSETFYSELIHLLFVWLFIAPHNIFVSFSFLKKGEITSPTCKSWKKVRIKVSDSLNLHKWIRLLKVVNFSRTPFLSLSGSRKEVQCRLGYMYVEAPPPVI